MKYVILFIILSISIKTFGIKEYDHLFSECTSNNVNFNILINTNDISQINIKKNIQEHLNNFFKKTFPKQKSTFVSSNNSLKREGDNINIIISINKVNISNQEDLYNGKINIVVNVYDVSKTPIQLRKKSINVEYKQLSNKQDLIDILVKQTNSKLTEYIKSTIVSPNLKPSNYIIND